MALGVTVASIGMAELTIWGRITSINVRKVAGPRELGLAFHHVNAEREFGA
jgi:hypothetical protein